MWDYGFISFNEARGPASHGHASDTSWSLKPYDYVGADKSSHAGSLWSDSLSLWGTSISPLLSLENGCRCRPVPLPVSALKRHYPFSRDKTTL